MIDSRTKTEKEEIYELRFKVYERLSEGPLCWGLWTVDFKLPTPEFYTVVRPLLWRRKLVVRRLPTSYFQTPVFRLPSSDSLDGLRVTR